jgi:ATP-dependent Clp protease ATP-binding subunit ClpA
LTDRAKHVIELAIDEARRLGHNYIGTEHLLLGLVREGEGIAAGVLESLGVNLDKVRKTTVDVISAGTPKPVGPAVSEEERLVGLARDHAAAAEEHIRLANQSQYPSERVELLTQAAVKASLAETYMRLADVDRRHRKR